MTDETQGNVPDEMYPASAESPTPGVPKEEPDQHKEERDYDYDTADDQAPAGPQPAPENPTVLQEEEYSRPHPAGKTPTEWIVMPNLPRSGTEEILETMRGAKNISKETAAWLQTLDAGTYHTFPRDELLRIVQPEAQGDWTNRLSHEDRAIGLRVPPQAQIAEGTVLAGNSALAQMARALNTSGTMQIPLYHTGIWLDFKVASDSELHMLEQHLAEHIYQLGYMTNGQLYSGTQTMLNLRLMDWALDRVVGGTVKDLSKAYLKSIIRVNDIQIIAHGLAGMAYPKGYPYSRACTASPTSCNHVESEVLRLSKLLWSDRRAYSPWQLKTLANRNAKLSPDDLERYQQEFIRGGERQVRINENFSVVLKAPTLEQYELSGYEWIEGIIDQTTRTMVNKSTKELDDIMLGQFVLTTMRQYGHWVSELVYENDIRVTGRDEINQSLALASGDSDVVDTFISAVREHLEDSTTTLVAIPKYNCPKCQAPQQTPGKSHPFLIPLDAVFVFFTLRDQKTRSSLFRNMDT